MTITYLGYMSILILLFAIMLKKKNILLFSAVFFSGFTGASVINFDVIAFSLQPSFFFLIMFILTNLFNTNYKLRLNNSLVIFFVFCCINSFMPLLLKDSVTAMNQDGIYTKLSYSISNIAHLSYLFLDLIFLNILYGRFKNSEVYNGCLRAFKYGLWGVAIICIYQLFAFKYNLEFDAFFRQNIHGNVQGTRLYGPCGEASMLCYYLAPGIMFLIIEKKNICDIILVGILSIIGLLTESSTFFIGLILIFIICIPKLLKFIFKYRSIKVKLLFLCILVLFLLFVLTSSLFKNIIGQLITKLKLQSLSGVERFDSFINMSTIGFEHPFGVGFGSSRSKDLLSTWLCNIGIVGILIFLVFIFDVILNAANNIYKVFPFLIVLVLMFVSVPEPYNFFIWFFVAYSQKSRKLENLSYEVIDNKRYVRMGRYRSSNKA